MNDNKINLLKKISQKQLQFGLIVVFASLIFLYFLTRHYIVTETEESLNNSEYRIEQLLKQDNKVTSLPPIFEVYEVKTLKPTTLKDTLILDELQNEDEHFKELNTYKSFNGKNYHIITRAIIVEYDDTLLSILSVFGIIISLIYLAQYIFNKQINKVIWQPFFNNLDAIKKYSIQSNKPLELYPSDVLEFSELNIQLELLTNKVATDFQNLKQFTEDLSHEVQTPLAIIQAKIENLIDSSKGLSDEHISVLSDIQKNSKRLSKLNKGLILLTKIDNQQFNELETIEINSLINSSVEDVQDIANIKNIAFQITDKKKVNVIMDRVLADVLFSNLIGNAIKHTSKNGKINIQLENESFTISNSGNAGIVNSHKLFHRFYKEDNRSQSLGLGLAIAKKICDFYQFYIQYTFENNKHCFSIKFKNRS
ncbi:MAG: HAMP domain-containing sensor histidine kinase [Aquaticitalea sp.]